MLGNNVILPGVNCVRFFANQISVSEISVQTQMAARPVPIVSPHNFNHLVFPCYKARVHTGSLRI